MKQTVLGCGVLVCGATCASGLVLRVSFGPPDRSLRKMCFSGTNECSKTPIQIELDTVWLAGATVLLFNKIWDISRTAWEVEFGPRKLAGQCS